MNKLLFILFAIIITDTCLCQTVDEYVKMGAACYNYGKYTEAIDNLDNAIESDPDNSEAYVYRGLSNANNGNYQDAIFDLDLAIYTNPQNAKAFFFRGLLKYESGRQKDYSKDIKYAFDLVWTNYLFLI